MPRATPAGLLTSVAQCVAVLVERKDGVKIGLTDATVAFTYAGVTYEPIEGAADASAIAQEAGTSVDNMQVSSLLDDVSGFLRSRDVAGLRYEDSRWTIFTVDYTDPANGIMILAKYRLARAMYTDTSLRMELLGLLSFLKQSTGRTLGLTCDVQRFGDKRCDPHQTIRTALSASKLVGAVQSSFVIDVYGDVRASGFYNSGDVTWTSGDNDGCKNDIKLHTIITPAAYNAGTSYAYGAYVTYGGHTYYSLSAGNAGHTPSGFPAWWAPATGDPTQVARITWRTPPAYPVAIGDALTLCFGCDRKKSTCKTVPNANNASNTNIENHHGYYLPSPDQIKVIGR